VHAQEQGRRTIGACEGCYTQKLSARWEEGVGGPEKIVGKTGAKKARESSKSEEESNASRKEWLRNFSTMKSVLRGMPNLPNQDEPAREPG